MNNWLIRRRTLLYAFAGYSLLRIWPAVAEDKLWSAAASEAGASDAQPVKVAIVVPATDVNKLTPMTGNGTVNWATPVPFEVPPAEAESYPDPGFAPLVVLISTITVGYLAQLAFDLWSNYNYGGLFIDATKSPPEIREHPALERGHVIIIHSDGKIEDFRPESVPSLERVLISVLG